MAAPTKVGHVGKQPTSLDGGPGIGLMDFHGDTNHARVTQKMSCNFKLNTYSVLWS